MLPVKPGLDLLDRLDIHNRGAVDPQELSWVEFLFKASGGSRNSCSRLPTREQLSTTATIHRKRYGSKRHRVTVNVMVA
jgi:hypothetical protein